MSEQVTKPGEGGVDLSKYVPKDEHEKLSNTLKDLEGSKKDLEAKLDEAKLSLLDSDYVSFKADKAAKAASKKVSAAISTISDEDVDNLSSKQLLNLAIGKAKEAVLADVIPAYEDMLRKQGATISDILAVLELQQVEKKYSDFGDFRDGVRNILETSRTPLTIEQAYLIARQNKALSEPGNKDDTTKKPSSEKPASSVPAGSIQKKEFESPEEASNDAWDSVVGAGKDTL